MVSILIPTDFSENAYNALRYAVSMINGNPVHIILLNTYQILPSTSEMFISIDDILQKNSENGLKAEIENVKKEFPDKNFSHDLVSLCGSLKFGMKQVIKEKKVDIVIMGTGGATGLEKLCLGTNASDIIKIIGKPVLILPERKEQGLFDNIVLAIDYKEKVDTAMMESLRMMARMYNAHINIVSVSPKGKLEEVRRNSNKSSICAELKDFSHSYDLIESDNVVEAINKFIKDKNANMLAIIPHKLGIFESFFHKSISKELVMKADIPLMAMH